MYSLYRWRRVQIGLNRYFCIARDEVTSRGLAQFAVRRQVNRPSYKGNSKIQNTSASEFCQQVLSYMSRWIGLTRCPPLTSLHKQKPGYIVSIHVSMSYRTQFCANSPHRHITIAGPREMRLTVRITNVLLQSVKRPTVDHHASLVQTCLLVTISTMMRKFKTLQQNVADKFVIAYFTSVSKVCAVLLFFSVLFYPVWI